MNSLSSRIKLATELDQELLYEHLVNFALANNYGIACWQLPGSSVRHLVIDCTGSGTKGKITLEDCAPGFILGPFSNEGLQETTFLQADIYYRTSEHYPRISQNLDYGIKESLASFLEETKVKPSSSKTTGFYKESYVQDASNRESFIELVNRCIGEIRSGHMKKIVPSRTMDLHIAGNIGLLDVFRRIHSFYPNSFASLISVPHLGTWLGASPELLLSLHENGTFKTVSLAGTQRAEKFSALAEVAWTQKEIEEQALVSRYIIDCFKKIRLREFDEKGPKTIRAGNLIHLKTDFEVDMNATNFPQLGSVMLELLHPTSAVCGMPLDPAKAFIKQYEGYDRAMYSGFLGPVNVAQESHIYVNLRCMQIFDSHIRIYAGAGVTEDSNPSKEWQETEDKCQTMLNLLDHKHS